MNNVDVPMWDKGDSTDSYSKGGGSMFEGFDSVSEKTPMIEEAYDIVLGRKPTSREISFYKYSTQKKEDIIKKLLNSVEHKEIVEKGRDYPLVEQREKLAKSNIIKLRHSIEDMSDEYSELSKILEQKNRAIDELREEKSLPYVSGSLPDDKYNVFYNSNDQFTGKEVLKKETFLDKLYKFLKDISK